MHELDSRVIKNGNGGYERHTWLPGAREDLGKVVKGWSGVETFVRTPVIKAIVVFEVVDRSKQLEPDYDLQARTGDGAPVR